LHRLVGTDRTSCTICFGAEGGHAGRHEGVTFTEVVPQRVVERANTRVARIIKTIEVYDNFCHANDPHEEHDFGAFEADGHAIFFKIDYFDPTLTVHSSDPSDPDITKRVITIMLADEY
jgi:hypothetical protein